ncbi:MAG: S41 family peptidase [Candidatus Latescibacteria bacterium]|nr:S41 family peptidase [Candidatus Latescibacterota bacterium]
MSYTRKKRNVIFLLLLIFLSGAWLLDHVRATEDAALIALDEGFDVFGEVYRYIANNYVEEIAHEEIIRAGIEGMLEELDPYTQFLSTKARVDQLKIDTTGEFGGLGIQIAVLNNAPTVISPIDGTPAYHIGLQAGDRIVQIEGDPTEGMSLEDVVSILRGKPGTSVTITIEREGEDAPIDFTIVREIIKVKSVTLAEKVAETVGYVRLARFRQGETHSATHELAEAIQSLKDQNIQAFILDLRPNPGGLLSEACSVADLFLEKGQLIVSTKGRVPRQNRQFFAEKDPFLDPSIPMVVLVGPGSASASEIVAGAIQDHDRGLIMGKPTFGKGSVQTLHRIGGDKELKLTTALYYTPSGRSIHKWGRKNAENPVASPGEMEHPHGIVPDEKDSTTQKTFFTDKERVVYGGGGITPDVLVESPELSEFLRILERRRIFFNFAVHYAALHPDTESDVSVDDELLEALQKYLDDPAQQFEYPTPGDVQIEVLEKLVEEEGYDAKLKAILADLRSALEDEKTHDFEKGRAYIQMALRREIASRLGGLDAGLRATFPEDVQLQKAIEILRNPALYAEKMSASPKTQAVVR